MAIFDTLANFLQGAASGAERGHNLVEGVLQRRMQEKELEGRRDYMTKTLANQSRQIENEDTYRKAVLELERLDLAIKEAESKVDNYVKMGNYDLAKKAAVDEVSLRERALDIQEKLGMGGLRQERSELNQRIKEFDKEFEFKGQVSTREQNRADILADLEKITTLSEEAFKRAQIAKMKGDEKRADKELELYGALEQRKVALKEEIDRGTLNLSTRAQTESETEGLSVRGHRTRVQDFNELIGGREMTEKEKAGESGRRVDTANIGRLGAETSNINEQTRQLPIKSKIDLLNVKGNLMDNIPDEELTNTYNYFQDPLGEQKKKEKQFQLYKNSVMGGIFSPKQVVPVPPQESFFDRLKKYLR